MRPPAGDRRAGRGGRDGDGRALRRSSDWQPGTIVGPGRATTWRRRSASAWRVGQAAMSLGTSGTIFAVSERPGADPSGIVAGFADATGRFLPLAATLNCTVAVDRVAGWLGLDRDDVAPAGVGGDAPLPRRRADAEPPAGQRHDPRAAPHDDAAADPDGRLRGRGGLAAGRVRCDRRGGRRARSGRAARAHRRRRRGTDLALRRPAADRPGGPGPRGQRAGRDRGRGAGGGRPPRRAPDVSPRAGAAPPASSSTRFRSTRSGWPGSANCWPTSTVEQRAPGAGLSRPAATRSSTGATDADTMGPCRRLPGSSVPGERVRARHRPPRRTMPKTVRTLGRRPDRRRPRADRGCPAAPGTPYRARRTARDRGARRSSPITPGSAGARAASWGRGLLRHQRLPDHRAAAGRASRDGPDRPGPVLAAPRTPAAARPVPPARRRPWRSRSSSCRRRSPGCGRTRWRRSPT